LLATTRVFSQKLAAALTIAVLLVALVGLVATSAFGSLGDEGHGLADAHSQGALDAERLRSWVNLEVTVGRAAAVARTPEGFAESDTARAVFRGRLADMRERLGDERSQEILSMLARGEQDLQLALEREAIGTTPVAVNDVDRQQQALGRAIDGLVSYEQRQAERVRQAAQEALARGQRSVAVVASGALLFSAGLALLFMRRLSRTFAAAQQAIHSREQFLSVASAELRQPINLMTQELDPLWRSGHLPPELAGRFDSANRQLIKLRGFVDELSEASQLTTGKLQLAREPIDLSALVRQVEARFAPQLARSGCVVNLQLSQSAVGFWDRSRLEEIITHLLSNALAHSHGRMVRVIVQPGDPTRLIVRDHGSGLSKEQLSHVFQAFDGTAPNHHPGNLGLGLYIVRRLVEAHGGRVIVESTLKLGSTFIVELPVQPPLVRAC
jgi:signal transduction histidine kinase